jgi:cytochrome b6-f complex iron-sulfur subunit
LRISCFWEISLSLSPRSGQHANALTESAKANPFCRRDPFAHIGVPNPIRFIDARPPVWLRWNTEMAKKLSTADILKAARAQSGQGGDPAAAAAQPPAEPAASAAPAEPGVAEPTAAPAAPAPTAAAPSAAPKSTKDILAAARAQTAGGAVAPQAKPPVPAAGAPKSTKDILAAARAQTAPGASAPSAATAKGTGDILAAARAQASKAPAAAAKPAGEKPVKAAPAKPAAPVAAAGARPSVQEMLKAAREGKTTAASAVVASAAAVKPALVEPVIPQKPVVAKKPPPAVEPRRGFLASMGGLVGVLFGTPFRTAWTTFTASLGIGGLATARFMMPNVLVEPPSKFKVGPPSDYPPASVATKWTAQYGVWLVHNEFNGKDLIYALQTVCTHLGCTPNWLEGERKFKCPCHGSGFYITGINFEGPAPRPLERMAIRLSEDGAIEVDKSRKFQQELGQWNDPASFVEVA